MNREVRTRNRMKSKTIDEYFNQPKGSYLKFVKSQEEKLTKDERDRILNIHRARQEKRADSAAFVE